MINTFEIILIILMAMALLSLALLGTFFNRYTFYWKSFFKGMVMYLIIRFVLINPLENLCRVYISDGLLPLIVRIGISAILLFMFIIKEMPSRDFQSVQSGILAAIIYVDVVRILIDNVNLLMELGEQAIKTPITAYLLLFVDVVIGYGLLVTASKHNKTLCLLSVIMGLLCIYFNNIVYLVFVFALLFILFNYKGIELWKKN